HVGGNDGLDDVVGDCRTQIVIRNRFTVLCRNHDGVHAGRTAFSVFNRDLRFAVGPEKVNFFGFADFGELVGELVGKLDWHGHQLGGFIARKAEHQALVAGATGVHSHSNVGRLALYSAHDRAGLAVVAILSAVVAYAADGIANELIVINVRRSRDFTCDDGQ